ncbi:uncharacterized protein LOC143548847 [Bidens hawaiensis]|uniref:uncharacterized protein LOC143548847 n=1 Tax=Bidens hawaiensis TaxID=980011 RepID=UPI00404B7605
MSKPTFNMICDDLDSALTEKDTISRLAIPVPQQVAVCLYRLANGHPWHTISYLFQLSISEGRKLVLEVCDAIRTVLMPELFQWQERQIKTEFGSTSCISRSIYTARIGIIQPNTYLAAYFNKKDSKQYKRGSHVQGVVDFRGRFTDVCIFNDGSMTMDMLSPKLWIQRPFNEKIGEMQKIADNAGMRLKTRWACLQNIAETRRRDLHVVVEACCVLHNICEINDEAMDTADPIVMWDKAKTPVLSKHSLHKLMRLNYRLVDSGEYHDLLYA